MVQVFVFVAICFFASTNAADICAVGQNYAEEAAKGSNNLAVKVYQNAVGSEPTTNVIFSPASISLALAALETGAGSSTRDQILHLILAPTSNRSGVAGALYQSLQGQLKIKSDDTELRVANGLFYAENLQLKEQYFWRAKQCLGAEVTKVPFAAKPEDARKQINQYVASATANKIPELLKQGIIKAQTQAVLANAIYFKAPWINQFEIIESLDFYVGGNQAKKAQFMVRKDKYPYTEDNEVAVLGVPYNGESLVLYVVLPKQRDGFKNLDKSVTAEKLQAYFSTADERLVNVKLPRFTIRQSLKLKDILQNLGVTEIFSDLANFTRMTDAPLHVSEAVHEAFIKVNENGTEAAAATAFIEDARSLLVPIKEPPVFLADHPFLFAIVHKPTSAIVFIGKVNSADE